MIRRYFLVLFVFVFGCIQGLSLAEDFNLGLANQPNPGGQGAGTSDKFETFNQNNISFEYPSSWKLEKVEGTYEEGQVSLFKLDPLGDLIYTSHIIVSWDKFIAEGYPESLLDALVMIRQRDVNYTNVEVVDSTPITVDDNRAAVRVVSQTDSNGQDVNDRYLAFNSKKSDRFIRVRYYSLAAIEDVTAYDHLVATLRDTAVPPPETHPAVNKLASSPGSPQKAGRSIRWTASASDPDGDKIFYKFLLKGPATNGSWKVTRDWKQSGSTWTWATSNADVGDNNIAVWVTDREPSDPNSKDNEKISAFTVTSSAESGHIIEEPEPIAKHQPSIPPVRAWDKKYGGSAPDLLREIQKTEDQGFIFAGSTKSHGNGGSDLWVVRIDQKGDVIWERTFGSLNDDEGTSVQRTKDSGYVVAGSKNTGSALQDGWLIKLDSTGVKEWEMPISSPAVDGINSVIESSDGTFVLTGGTIGGSGERDLWLLKVNSNRTVRWQRAFGSSKGDVGQSVKETPDGGYVVVGTTGISESGTPDIWVIKTDSNGNKQWDRTFGGIKSDEGTSVQVADDGGYIILGTTRSLGKGGSDLYLIRTDRNGSPLWERTFGGGKDEIASSVQKTSDGGYLLSGSTESFGSGGSDVWLLKVDDKGNEEWNLTSGGPKDDKGYSALEIANGSYIVGGLNGDSGSGDAWIVAYSPP